MAREPNKIAVSDASVKRGNRVASKPAPSNTQEAKDLRLLISTLSEKNAPETSKDITLYAKQTLKVVAQSQKSESAAFRREATKTLIGFRTFVEKTEKLSELRRTKLLGDIDSVQLDVKNATMMLLSVAKEQAKNIKSYAKQEAAEILIRTKQFEKDAQTATKNENIEMKLKSKAISDEKLAKMKLVKDDRDELFKTMKANHDANVKRERDAIKTKREDQKTKIALKDSELKIEKDKFKIFKDDEKLKLKSSYDTRNIALAQKKVDQQNAAIVDRDKIKKHRDTSALLIKKLRGDLRDDHKQKALKSKTDSDDAKLAFKIKAKDRFQKIRDLADESKIRIKKIEDGAKAESLIKRALIKDEINQTMKNEDKKEATRNKHADGLKDKVKDGFMEANPLIQAAMEIGQGIHGMMTRGKVEDRKKSALQKVNQKNTSVNPSSVSATAPAAAATTSAPANASTSIASDIIGSIGSFISGIASGFSKVSKFLSKGVKFIPIIGTVAAVIGGIFDFMEGFNDASSLFGEKIADDDYVKRIYSGFTSVVGSILGIFDTVAGWLGFDTNLEGSFKEGAVKLFNTILDCFKSVVGGLASLLSYIPGMGDTAAKMKAYASSGSSTSAPEGPSAASTISDKQNNVNNLTDEVEASKSKSSQIQVNADNSVKTNSTTIVNDRMSTRNDDRIYEMYI